MKFIDYYLQKQRYKRVLPHIKDGTSILDIGCFDDSFYQKANKDIEYTGIDPSITPSQLDKCKFVAGSFPNDLPAEGRYDIIVCLAVFEHISEDEKHAFAQKCHEILNDRGRIYLSVPSPRVDDILHLLLKLKLADGMDHEAHHHFDVSKTESYFTETGLSLLQHKKFQFGLNNLFVFEKVCN